jgi:hypothetical protein
MLDQERPLKLSWYSKWAVHAGKPTCAIFLNSQGSGMLL